MKIVYVGAFRLPNKDAAAPRVLNNAKIFQALGHDVFFLSWGGEYRPCDKIAQDFYAIDGARYIVTNEIDCSGSFLKKLVSRILRGRKSLKILTRMRKEIDVVVTYNADFFFTLLMYVFCKIHKKKLINDITEWYDNGELKMVDVLFNSLNMNYLQHLVSNKIVISSFLNKHFKKSNNLILPPLCDIREKKWQNEIDDNQVPIYEGITLIYAGNPAKKDNVHVAINVINNLIKKGHEIRFVILGITKQNYLERYGNLLSCSSLHDNIIFLGKVSQDLVPAYYKKADFMILFRDDSRKNMAGFPTKFAESMVAGVPVISNSTSDISKYIVNGKNGFLVEKMNNEDLSAFLENEILKLDRNDILKMKSNARQNSACFLYQNYISQTQSFFDQLI